MLSKVKNMFLIYLRAWSILPNVKSTIYNILTAILTLLNFVINNIAIATCATKVRKNMTEDS